MLFKIVRNDITKMNTEVIVNTACARPAVGSGCDRAVYKAAGYEELLKYRKETDMMVQACCAPIRAYYKRSHKY